MNSEMKKNFEKVDFDPRVWGPKGWFFLETIVRSLPNDIDKELETKIKTFLKHVAFFLPCTFCTKHMQEYIIESDLDNISFGRKIDVIKWLNVLHNNRLKHKKRTLEQVENYYKREYDVNNTTYVDLLCVFVTIISVTLILKTMMR